MTEAITFDVDGTLVNSVDAHAQAWHEAFREFGFDVGVAQARTQIGKGGDQLLPIFLSPLELESVGDELEAYRSKLFESKYLERVKPFARVPDLFGLLKERGVKTGVASSFQAAELKYYLALCQISALVDVQATGEDVQNSKPSPDVVEVVLRRFGNPPKAGVWMVGASPFDAESATRAGIRAVGVRCGGFPSEDLLAAGCIALFEDPEDLWKKFDGSVLSPTRQETAHVPHR